MTVIHGIIHRRTPSDDAFLASVDFVLSKQTQGGFLLKNLLRFINCREEKELRVVGTHTIFVRVNQQVSVPDFPAVFCTATGMEYICVQRSPKWLSDKLLNSARTATTLKRGIRPILDVADLLNTRYTLTEERKECRY